MNSKDILEKAIPTRDNLIPTLHKLQDNNPENYLPNEVLKDVAKRFNLPLSSVFGVVGYYTMFSRNPRGKYIVRLCNSPVCHLSGSENVIVWAEEILGIKFGQTTADKMFTIEESECLGRCGKAPSMMVNSDFFGELTRDKLIQILENYRSKTKPS
jgi:NADH:ubiquinone oxidoreductase subunit E